MKRRTYLGTGAVVLALAGLVFFNSGLSQTVSGGAATLGKPALNFNQGIGFYVYSGGQLAWLDYPLYDENQIRQERRLVSKDDFRLFAYGIDFSKSAYGLPPHLGDFAVVLQDVQLNIDNPDFAKRRFEERQGPYAVHFIPIAGYDQPVYEITCDLWAGLRKKDVPPAIWGLRVAGGNAPEIFWFAFRTEGAGT